MHGQHHHPQGGALADELPRRLEPGELRHGDIEDREVELAGEAPCDRFGPVAGLLGDPQVRLAVEDRAEPLAHDRVVVGQEDPGDQRRGGVTRRAPGAGSPAAGTLRSRLVST